MAENHSIFQTPNHPTGNCFANLFRWHALTGTEAGKHSHLLHTIDMMSKVFHFVDTGAEANILAANRNDRLHEPLSDLQSANRKPTATWDK